MNDSDLSQPGAADTSMRQLTLLVVEDDQGLNQLIQKRLRRHGFATESAKCGAEAVRRAAELADPLLLLDYQLPDMTANEVILALAAQQHVAPFIVMTGNGDERIAVEMMKLGARDYLPKSESFLDLLPTVVLQTVARIATERRLQQTERALREAEHRFGLLFQRAAVGIGLVTIEGQALIANDALLRITGYSLEEFRQINMAQLYLDSAVRPAIIQRVVAEGRIRQTEVTMRCKDGALFQASCSFDLLEFEGSQTLLVTAEDITERIAAQQRISHLNAVLNGIRRVNRLITEEPDRDRLIQGACESLIQTFGYYNAWIAYTGQDGRILATASAGFSGALAQLNTMTASAELPWCARQTLTHSAAVAIRKPAVDCADCPFGSTCPEEARMLIRMVYNDQGYGIMSVGLAPGYVDDHEEQALFAEVACDLAFALHKIDLEAERRRAEADLHTSQMSLRRALDELEQRVAERTRELSIANADLARAARVKDEFLANMSHELRTPLNAILGRSEMFREGLYGSLSESQSAALLMIEESGHHLLDLINDVLDVSKIEAGHVVLDLNLVPIATICEASLRLVSQQALKKQLRLTKRLDPAITKIRADGRRLKQILVNLLSNAVKFTPSGGEIGLEVTGDHERGTACFTVWDTGIGIAAADLARLFQPFVQVDSSLARAHEGTGLGLTLVSRLARLHGGSIDVASVVGQGSRFSITLPWHTRMPEAGEAPPPDAPGPLTPHQDDHPADGPLILLADDNDASIDLIKAYLEARGLRLAVAHDGLEAVQLAAALRPALILMDVQMPRLDGLAATRQIRADADLHHIPVIALTALAMPGDRERCLEAGANDYISKPISLRRLAQMVSSFVQPA
ncbi:MAG: response regulator [Chloroflexales bacterium]|nr:response regulator [Chloroflexales bacterium]